jgi:hypothetical protein
LLLYNPHLQDEIIEYVQRVNEQEIYLELHLPLHSELLVPNVPNQNQHWHYGSAVIFPPPPLLLPHPLR